MKTFSIKKNYIYWVKYSNYADDECWFGIIDQRNTLACEIRLVQRTVISTDRMLDDVTSTET